MKLLHLNLMSILLITTTLTAQNAADKDIINLDPVTVLAKSSTRANTVLRYELQEFSSPATSALDRIDVMPGVVIQEGDAYGGDDWSTTVSIRGFQTTRSTNQLGYTIDDLPNGSTNYDGGAKPNRFIDSENIREVSVSQGASDISSASISALGGTIKYYMDDPRFEKTARLDYSTGDNNMHKYFSRVDTGLLNKNTRGFVSISESHHNRWTETGSNGLSDRMHIDSKWITKLGNIDVELRASWDDTHEDNYNGVSLEEFAQNPNWDRLTGEWTGNPVIDQMYVQGWSTVRENTLIGAKFVIPVGNTGTLEINPYLHNQNGEGHWIPPYQRRGLDENGNPVAFADRAVDSYRVFWVDPDGNEVREGNEIPEGSTPISSFRTSHYKNSRYGTRIDYNQMVGDLNEIQAGLWYENQERQNWRNWHKVLNSLVGMEYDHREYWTDFNNTFDTETTMLYIQDTIKFEKLQITAGLKKFLVDISKYDNINRLEEGSIDSKSDILPNVGAVVSFSEAGQMFANFTSNHGAITDVYLREGTDLSRMEPEKADSIDLGYRHSGENYSFSTSIYQIKFDNKISNITQQDASGGIDYDVGDGGAYLNVGGIESSGFEFAGNYRINKNWSLYGSATINNSEYTKTIPSNNVFKGKEVVGAASQIFVASILYSDDSGLYGGMTIKHTGDRQGTLDNSEQMEAYQKVDLNLGYRHDFEESNGFFKSFKAELKVYNLLDESYIASPDGDGYASKGRYFIGAPRSVSTTFSLEF